VTELLVPPGSSVTPESAGWSYVGFEPLEITAGDPVQRDTGPRECCVVVIAGRVDLSSEHGDWRGLGGRATPFGGAPDAAYLPPGTRFTLSGAGELGLCFAPAERGAEPRVLPAASVLPETRGHGAHERTVNPILMGDEQAEALLVCEVHTPAGHWSSYPPHKHDRDALPDESLLEETYYFRVHRGPQPGRDAHGARSRHGGGAARLPHRLRAAPLYALLPQRDGRTGARVGGCERPGPRMDTRAVRLKPRA